jgi:hypothetical protein
MFCEHESSLTDSVRQEQAACMSLGLLFSPQYGDCMFLQNVSEFLQDYTTSDPRTQDSSQLLPCALKSNIRISKPFNKVTFMLFAILRTDGVVRCTFELHYVCLHDVCIYTQQ